SWVPAFSYARIWLFRLSSLWAGMSCYQRIGIRQDGSNPDLSKQVQAKPDGLDSSSYDMKCIWQIHKN
ncbi:MAG: hypothetical protein KC643_25720, partial [Nitrospira sp.]|nr:hypothetical protein [Nitrospira sp.]